MKFHEYKTARRFKDRDSVGDAIQSWIEGWWIENVRPYYKVFPAIIPSLMKIPLSIRVDDLQKRNRVFLVRFQDPSPIVLGKWSLTSVLCAFTDDTEDSVRRIMVIGRCISSEIGGELSYGPSAWDAGGVTLEERLATIPPEVRLSSEITPEENQLIKEACFRIAFCVNLLDDNPSSVVPEVLAADREKYEATHDQKYIDKARRRGVVGWSIGADYEVCPHYRRPHFALRYTGKGGTIPRIVPVKGAVVHRSKLTDVPTGHILPDGTEVEPE